MQLVTVSQARLVPARPARAAATRRLRARRAVITAVAEKDRGVASDEDEGGVSEYCSIGPDGKRVKLTLGEKEQLFLEALSTYYYEGTALISDEEFANLKDDLVWNGSKVAVLSGAEQRYLEAQLAYNAGKPIMSDADFDALKVQLRQSNSVVTAQGPRCSIRTRKLSSDASVDYLKLTLINLPAALVVLGFVFSIDDLTGFEITKLVELPSPWGIVVLWGFILPVIYVLASSITNLIFKDALILKAPCPNCNTENTVYFGDILTIQGNRKENTVPCSNCKTQLRFDARTREVDVVEEAQA
ncbi:PGR5 chloroplastic [Chlorella sorokiniana]|jgi:hypothetical protein|uniref:PGR5 chloroplastic n=1 Tax=Chlorella sorokiniana TaxID=3076 RepID=A0A2P6TBE9_CHLSO|nr:PGR5 chloroplastic [Chlorella sorokiniana]|eukprot:PRW05866.1 PGR5 chloroplastic [Chlorella sorokiniana]